MIMNRFLTTLMSAAFILGGIYTAQAALVERDYDPGKPRTTTPWFETIGAENIKADRHFITGMRPHHAGALSMSQDYLENQGRSSARLQRLAKGIMHNQTFEILMLDTVEGLLQKANLPEGQRQRTQVAASGLAQKEKFIRAAIPSLQSFGQRDQVSESDVRFAKAMIVHHEGALVMCNDYLANPDSANGYLELMCLDILRDQKQEIALMNLIIGDYPGNADDVTFDPSMVHGMEGMSHGNAGGHAGHGKSGHDSGGHDAHHGH